MSEEPRVGNCAYCGWRVRTRISRQEPYDGRLVAWHHKPSWARPPHYYSLNYCMGSAKPIAELETDQDVRDREANVRDAAICRDQWRIKSKHFSMLNHVSHAKNAADELGLSEIEDVLYKGVDAILDTLVDKGYYTRDEVERNYPEYRKGVNR